MLVSFGDMILQHAQRDALAVQMAAFYDRVDRAVERHGAVCRNRGVCCHFGRYGHKLYVTSVELAYFVLGHQENWRIPRKDTACPYQIEGQCTARNHRPLGCRVFYCDPETQHWQNDEYERHLKDLKAISEACGVDYHYCEWLSALESVRIDPVEVASNQTVSPAGIDRIPLPVIE